MPTFRVKQNHKFDTRCVRVRCVVERWETPEYVMTENAVADIPDRIAQAGIESGKLVLDPETYGDVDDKRKAEILTGKKETRARRTPKDSESGGEA